MVSSPGGSRRTLLYRFPLDQREADCGYHAMAADCPAFKRERAPSGAAFAIDQNRTLRDFAVLSLMTLKTWHEPDVVGLMRLESQSPCP